MGVYRISIDPGHGGVDPGAMGPSGLLEKNVNLQVARAIRALAGEHLEILLTRTGDTTVNLSQRSSEANQEQVDLLVSIHCNASSNRTANGTETFCYQFGGKAEQLARMIQRELVRATSLVNRGVKEGNLHMVREPNMPAVLVELAFISNPREERLLQTADFQNRCAQAILNGIGGFLMANPVSREIRLSGVDYNNQEFEAYLIEGKLFVEVRDFANALGRSVSWDPESGTATVRDMIIDMGE
jgi:N-acetylmuramoyl-L-alanine amidase